jgi:hypothetical protein
MRQYTLKNIPESLYALAETTAQANFRSLNQELLYRVQLAFDLEEAGATKLHQQWIDESLASGPAKPANKEQWDRALKQGLAKAEPSQ